MHLNLEDNSNIKLDRSTLGDLIDYINDSDGEFGVGNTRFGEVPSQSDVGNNVEEYLKYALSIKKSGNERPIGLIFFRDINGKALELSIILKKEYRNKNILYHLVELNEKLKADSGIEFLHTLLRGFLKSRIVTSVTKNSHLEKILIKLGFIMDQRYTGNNKVLYSLY